MQVITTGTRSRLYILITPSGIPDHETEMLGPKMKTKCRSPALAGITNIPNQELHLDLRFLVLRTLQTPQRRESDYDPRKKHGGKVLLQGGLCQAVVEETLCKTLNINDLVFTSGVERGLTLVSVENWNHRILRCINY